MMGRSPLFSSKKIVFKPALSGLFFRQANAYASGVNARTSTFACAMPAERSAVCSIRLNWSSADEQA
jgi:hypothetical protein